MNSGPYLFDVSLIALAHAGTPVSDPALRYVRQAMAGEIDVIVPHSALIRAQHILRRVYRFSNDEAARFMVQFRDARRIHWYEGVPEALLRDSLTLAGITNIGGWDGYYGAIARSEGVETILTLDDDFEHVDGIACDVILDTEQFETLSEYIDYL